MNNCNSLLKDRLVEEFDRDIRIDEDQGDCRVIFPFVRPDGDPIILYVIEEEDHFVITDEGETHGMLLTSGVEINTEKRKNRVQAAKTRFGLDSAKKQIRLTATDDTLGERLWEACQAVQWISFLIYTRHTHSPSYFKDKVAVFLRENNYIFEEDATVTAESEDQTVDFAFDRLSQPTYLESIQAPTASALRSKSRDTSWKWIKIERVDPDARFVTVVDDEEGSYKKENIQPLLDDSDAVIPWTERQDLPTALGN